MLERGIARSVAECGEWSLLSALVFMLQKARESYNNFLTSEKSGAQKPYIMKNFIKGANIQRSKKLRCIFQPNEASMELSV